MKAVVLAAGKGLRMMPLTAEKPKALLELRGKPLIEYAFESCLSAGINEAAVVVGYLREQIVSSYGSEFNSLKIEYVEQETQLGTAHAIGLCRNFLDGDFLAINCDVVFGKGLLEGLMAMNGFDAVVVARKEEEPWKFGCLKVEGNKLLGIEEKPVEGGQPSDLVNAGVYRFSDKIFGAIASTSESKRKEFEVTDSINLLAGGGKAGFLEFDGKIEDIGSLEDLERANAET